MAKKILIVDDELDILKVTAYRLKKAGYEVTCAMEGQAALDSIKKERPDFVLLDVHLPGIDGIEVCRRIKKEENLKDIPVVFFTASSDLSIKEKVGSVKADGLLIEPFEAEELLQTVRRLTGT